MEDIRKGTCPLCRHNQIIEALAMDLMGRAAYAAAITVTFRGDGAFASHGVIRRYVCQRCGFMQSFADEPASIPIDEDHKTRLITGPEPTGPYR